jgi:hypothetical protein
LEKEIEKIIPDLVGIKEGRKPSKLMDHFNGGKFQKLEANIASQTTVC